jgi:DNA modification methylase
VSVQDVLDGKRLWSVACGDSAAMLSGWPAECVQTSICSPPYFALRSYLPKGHKAKSVEIGSENTVEAYLDRLLAVFHEVRRVLVPHGTCWVNLGDTFSSGGRSSQVPPSGSISHPAMREAQPCRAPAGLASDGNLLGVPWRFAEAMKADGWILRSAMVWQKPAPLPESVSGWAWRRCRVKAGNVPYDGKLGGYGNASPERERSLDNHKVALWQDCPGCPKCRANNGLVLRKGSWRPTRSHEFVFMFAKSGSYFADGEPVRTSFTDRPVGWLKSGVGTTCFGTNGPALPGDERQPSSTLGGRPNPAGANLRDVLTISSEPQGEFVLPDGRRISHFAAFPSHLVETLILCSTSAKGHCPRCKMPVVRVIDKPFVGRFHDHSKDGVQYGLVQDAGRPLGGEEYRAWIQQNGAQTIGWKPSCSCPEAELPVADVVLDPFCGSGTSGLTALRLGRRFLGVDLHPDYVDLARWRLAEEMPLFSKE